ncbi:MAG: phenylalanine--tRNA ligase subunit beta [Proteobacteria bacterium]|nr:phenylalanine--tRNA ligase subunit beta [Pseudomonadota bacterium]
MKFTLSWLKEYLQTDAGIEEICHKLTDIGLEVESVEDQAQSLSFFSIAHIVEASPHPEADKLQICKVDVGASENLQIICGAANARKGLKVAYAPIGAVIPANGMKIKKSKIRGIESHGMLCSAVELGLGGDSEGIIEIDDHVTIGTKVSELYGLDSVIEVNITPNRGDCLGVYGIARDLAAAGLGVLKKPQVAQVKANNSSAISVSIADNASEKCPYFTGRYIKNVTNCASPKWLQERLEAIGVNSISALVDITNYVMYCLNHPLHAYDADKIKGDIVVRNSKEGENFKSLKDIEYKLSGEELVIADDNGAIGLAGVIGGDSTSSQLETKNVFLEAAFFEASNIARTGRKLNIISDSRYRFERNIDLATVRLALDMATNLILEICGGQASEIVEAGSSNPDKRIINFDLKKIKQILGIEIAQTKVKEILTNLDFELKESADKASYQVIIPSFRADIALEEDLIEEIIRIYGYDKVKSCELPNFQAKTVGDDNKTQALEASRNTLCQNGLNEIISWSFINSNNAKIFTDLKDDLFVSNPISVDMDYMRPSLLLGLLSFAKKNQARDFNNLAAFEIGRTFAGVDPTQQKDVICAIRIGKNKEKSIYKDDRAFDCFDVKKDLFDCLGNFGIVAKSVQISDCDASHYHPYRSANVKLGKNIIARFGELHPILNKKLDVSGRINAFELFVDELPNKNSKKPASKKPFTISDFQAVNRDFAFIFNKEVKIGELIRLVEGCEKELINKVNIFDIYEGERIGEGKKSVAFNIKIQPKLQTLSGEEIEQISDKIIKEVSQKLGGVLRDGS